MCVSKLYISVPGLELRFLPGCEETAEEAIEMLRILLSFFEDSDETSYGSDIYAYAELIREWSERHGRRRVVRERWRGCAFRHPSSSRPTTFFHLSTSLFSARIHLPGRRRLDTFNNNI